MTWPDVLRVLDDAGRSETVAALRASGFSADSFGGQRQAREIVADSLTRAEDRLELAAIDAGGSGRGRRRALLTERRRAIREIRRRLEWELWP